jgi:hypothetical protein
MAAPTQAVNVYYRRIALHVFDCPPCQFRWKRKEYFDALTDAEPGPGLEANPAFGWIYAFASRRQRNRFQNFVAPRDIPTFARAPTAASSCVIR